MILIGAGLFLVITTAQPDPLPAPWRESTSNALFAYAGAAASTWKQSGRKGLAAYLQTQGKRTNSQYQFLDAAGTELSGLPIDRPENWDNPLHNEGQGGRFRDRMRSPDGPPDGGPLGGFFSRSPFNPNPPPPPPDSPPPPPELAPDEWQRLQQDALHHDDAVFFLAGPRVMAAQSVTYGKNGRFVLLALLPRPRFGRPAADPLVQAGGVLMVLAISGLVCYGLVRYLTSPIISLRLATHRLAAGDLTARTGAARRARRDEMADLGRDFDTMAERIEALVTAQRRLLGDISHELRSPLARLTIGLALARRYAATGAGPEQIEVAFDRIKRETARLNFLIEQLLQLTRLESGEAGAGNAPIELQRLVREVVDDTNFEIEGSRPEADRSVVLTASCPAHIIGSPDLLRSAVENVVRNAIRYTHPGTAVEVSLSCEMPLEAGDDARDVAVIRVRDHGDGVPPEALSELFRPFYRVEDARDRESGGVGLGLAITDRAVRSHGGSVSAQNAEGGGLLVELRLPVELTAQADETVKTEVGNNAEKN